MAEVDVLMLAEAHGIDSSTKGLYPFYVDCVSSQPKQAQPEQCTWSQVDDEHTPDTWSASCGAMWTFTDGGPKDNDMSYCPKCGKAVIEAAHGITKAQP